MQEKMTGKEYNLLISVWKMDYAC